MRSTSTPALLLALLLATPVSIPLAARVATAQVERPAEQLPEPVEPEADLETPSLTLPPIGPPGTPAPPTPSTRPEPPEALRVTVREIAFRGATRFSQGELAALAAPWLGRPLSSGDLAALVRSITQRYVDAGYVTSGALLPDQDLASGRLQIEIVEGRVEEIAIEGARSFRPAWFRTRLERATRAPVDVERLADQLAVFQRNPRIERVQAVLEPTDRIGVTRLRVAVQEASPYDFQLHASNESPPAIGSWGGGPELTIANLVGWGDTLSIAARFTRGLQQVSVQERFPLNRYDTELVASYRYTEADVVDSPFAFADITSQAHQAELELRHPVWRSGPHEVWLGVVGSWARSRARLLGGTACVEADLVDCEPTASVVRLRQEYLWRSRSTVVSARSSLSFGFSSRLLDSTREREAEGADSEFVSWLAQVRWLQRLPTERLGWHWPPSPLLVVRGDVQLANDPLLPTEQIAIGGPDTVRGYRRNALVRDSAAIGSVELRVPVWTRPFGEPVVELGPFFDIGGATDARGPIGLRTLSSVGLALRVHPGMGLRAEASWGHRLRDALDAGEGWQRDGIYLQVAWDVF
ncbi:MAG: POTRA domain-containing protein [Myxococcota bacterium]